MTLGSSFAFHMSLSSSRARCHCPLLSHALIPALKLTTSGPSFASHISLSSAKARCHCPPVSHALIPALNEGIGLQLRLPHLAEQHESPLPLLALPARADPSV
ncbi:unnamed protein product [Prorocentrum cordatum]|uniref:Uncharacterized protein n=1 Tax=Prorocentrum cordatum TaxID=2364126 RepID=A0ABN9Y8H4_9DINO|nr:unnamed protein product [Polarella glacialis]